MAETETADAPLLSDLSDRDKPWDRHKADSQEVARLYFDGGHQRRCERMLSCADQLQFALLPEDDDQISIRLKQARFCRQRHCPICSWRKAMMWRSRVLRSLHPDFDKGKSRSRYILQDYPTARFLHLTLTVKNPPMEDLRATCQLMSKAWRKLSKRRTFPAIGWIRALEVTREKDKQGYPHPHYHCLLMVPTTYFSKKYITQKQWVQMWKQSLRVSYDPVVDVRAVKSQTTGKTQGVDGGVIEVLKYDIKSDDLKLDAEWLSALTSQMTQLKSVAVGGVFKDYINEDDPDNFIRVDDDDDGEDLSQYPQWWFGWREMVNHYQRDKVVEPEIEVDDRID